MMTGVGYIPYNDVEEASSALVVVTTRPVPNNTNSVLFWEKPGFMITNTCSPADQVQVLN